MVYSRSRRHSSPAAGRYRRRPVYRHVRYRRASRPTTRRATTRHISYPRASRPSFRRWRR